MRRVAQYEEGVRQHVRGSKSWGGAARRNFDWIFCARELHGSPTGVTAHSSSATAGANQDHRANQDHNPERLWRQRGVVGASPQERDAGAGFEMRAAIRVSGRCSSVTHWCALCSVCNISVSGRCSVTLMCYVHCACTLWCALCVL